MVSTAEALSGMARAFFYAGARALLVSHREVGSDAAVKLTTRAFAELKANPKIGRAEALRISMHDLIDKGTPAEAHPSQAGTVRGGRRRGGSEVAAISGVARQNRNNRLDVDFGCCGSCPTRSDNVERMLARPPVSCRSRWTARNFRVVPVLRDISATTDASGDVLSTLQMPRQRDGRPLWRRCRRTRRDAAHAGGASRMPHGGTAM